MKKSILLLIIILIIGLSFIYFTDGNDRSLKKIPESAVLV